MWINLSPNLNQNLSPNPSPNLMSSLLNTCLLPLFSISSRIKLVMIFLFLLVMNILFLVPLTVAKSNNSYQSTGSGFIISFSLHRSPKSALEGREEVTRTTNSNNSYRWLLLTSLYLSLCVDLQDPELKWYYFVMTSWSNIIFCHDE